jgi:transposase-like protein
MKQSYGLDKKQAAVKALERGENLTKVSHQFQVTKRTLLWFGIVKNTFFKEVYFLSF